MNKVLFIAVHPDDETLGFGGTILKHRELGDEIYWLIITNISEKEGWSKEKVNQRQKEISIVAEKYKFNKYFKLDFPTTKLDQIPFGELVSEISNIVLDVKPHTIYFQNGTDVHTDHQIAFKAIWSCTKNFRYPFIKRILIAETLSETEFSPPISNYTFIPNVHIDVTKFFDEKLMIIKEFSSEIMDKPMPRSISTIEALAKVRGSRIGVEYAESFVLLFENK